MEPHRRPLFKPGPHITPLAGVSRRAVAQAEAQLLAQQWVINMLQTDLAAINTRGSTAAKVPAPEKCVMEMSMAAFRFWKRSMMCWMQLNGWNTMEAIHHTRLN